MFKDRAHLILFFKEVLTSRSTPGSTIASANNVVMRAARSIAATRAYDYPRRSAIAGGASPGR